MTEDREHTFDQDEPGRVSLKGLDPKQALKALLKVDPDAPPAGSEPDKDRESGTQTD